MKDIGVVLSEQEIINKFNERTRTWIKDEGHWLTLAIHCNSTNAFIGSIGFNIKSISCQSAEIGYLVLSQFQGKGYITEAGEALIDFLFNQVKVRKIIAYCTTRNTSSWRVMEKLGLQREGILKSDFSIGDSWFDSYVYGYVNPLK
jgi:RimJ/RimL family protein N-acetyltransferase